MKDKNSSLLSHFDPGKIAGHSRLSILSSLEYSFDCRHFELPQTKYFSKIKIFLQWTNSLKSYIATISYIISWFFTHQDILKNLEFYRGVDVESTE